LSFWDFATGASYLPIDMNPTPSVLPCILRIGLTFLNQRYLQQQLQQQGEANNHKLGYYYHKNQTAFKHYLSTWQTVVD
jgi:hypothetical protein